MSTNWPAAAMASPPLSGNYCFSLSAQRDNRRIRSGRTDPLLHCLCHTAHLIKHLRRARGRRGTIIMHLTALQSRFNLQSLSGSGPMLIKAEEWHEMMSPITKLQWFEKRRVLSPSSPQKEVPKILTAIHFLQSKKLLYFTN